MKRSHIRPIFLIAAASTVFVSEAARADPACDAVMSSLRATSSVCDATDSVLFERDTTGGCLRCAYAVEAIDTTVVSTADCDDLPSSQIPACITALDCLFGINPQPNGTYTTITPPAKAGMVAAYCGTTESASDCSSSSPGPEGACASPLKAAGLHYCPPGLCAGPGGSTPPVWEGSPAATVPVNIELALAYSCPAQCFPTVASAAPAGIQSGSTGFLALASALLLAGFASALGGLPGRRKAGGAV
jgi:hypothetical protein